MSPGAPRRLICPVDAFMGPSFETLYTGAGLRRAGLEGMPAKLARHLFRQNEGEGEVGRQYQHTGCSKRMSRETEKTMPELDTTTSRQSAT